MRTARHILHASVAASAADVSNSRPSTRRGTRAGACSERKAVVLRRRTCLICGVRVAWLPRPRGGSSREASSASAVKGNPRMAIRAPTTQRRIPSVRRRRVGCRQNRPHCVQDSVCRPAGTRAWRLLNLSRAAQPRSHSVPQTRGTTRPHPAALAIQYRTNARRVPLLSQRERKIRWIWG